MRVGDIVGSVYEFNWIKNKDFDPLFSPLADFTDDTVCTVALADCLLNEGDPAKYLRHWCNKYPNRGYGGLFSEWLSNPSMQAYDSFGNGSGMTSP
jgi:ADP-ribosylglycohydrolase